MVDGAGAPLEQVPQPKVTKCDRAKCPILVIRFFLFFQCATDSNRSDVFFVDYGEFLCCAVGSSWLVGRLAKEQVRSRGHSKPVILN